MVSKLASASTGDTLSWTGDVAYAPAKYPSPFYIKSLSPKAKGDEDKISSAVTKLLEEDLTLKYEVNRETSQMLLSGLGGTHLDITLAKMKARYGVEVVLGEKKIAYRETIRKSAKVEGKHKKQSGGHGQYGHCIIEMTPQEPGAGYAFENKIVGGVIPKEFIAPIDAGIREAAQSGILGGFEVVDFKASVFDGSYHDVDSSEMAFKIAGSMAFKEALQKADPALLEPMMKVEVIIPEQYMGDVIGDISSRRGRIEGMEARMGEQTVHSFVPLSEMFGYATDLRSRTQGRGLFTMQFDHYEEVPKAIAEKVTGARKG